MTPSTAQSKCKADFYALWCDSCNLHPASCPLRATPAPTDTGALADEPSELLTNIRTASEIEQERLARKAARRAAHARVADTDCEMAFIEACDEAGCAYDNEALLKAIADLKRNSAPQETRGDERTATITECINVKVLLTNIGGRSDDWIRGFDAGTNAFIDALEKLRTLATTLRGAGASMIDGLSPSDLANWTDNSNCNAGIALAASQQSPRLEREGEVVWLREVDANTDSACWVVCNRVDPSAVAFLPDVTALAKTHCPVPSTDPLCPDCGRSLNGPTHATYCIVSSNHPREVE